MAALAVAAAALNFLNLITSKKRYFTRGDISSLIHDVSTNVSRGIWLIVVRLVSINILLDVLPQMATFLTW
jgi:hypothetical protein